MLPRLVASVVALGSVLVTEAFMGPTRAYQGSFVARLSPQWVGATPARGLAAGLSMITTADFKNGLTIEIDGAPVKITEFLHVKPGKGSAFVRSKLKNLITGNTVEKTFRAGESMELAQVDRMDLQYTYADEDNFNFMDSVTYEEVSIARSVVGDTAGYMSEGMTVEALKWNGKVIDFSVPSTMTFTVAQTDPGVKGNTAQGGSKPATLETGAVISVPLFIAEGEKIRVDTVNKKYMSRANED